MALSAASYGGNTLGRANAAAGTAYYAVVPGQAGVFTRVASFAMTSGNTANDGVWLRPIGRTTTAAASNTSVNTVTLTADPGPSGNGIAANDLLVIEHSDNVQRRYTVGAWNGTTKVATLVGSNFSVSISNGARVWNFGVDTDIDPVLGTAHPRFSSVANAQRVYTFSGAGIAGHNVGDPVLFYNPNATNATVLDYAEYVRSKV
jgi:hypothetical protein